MTILHKPGRDNPKLSLNAGEIAQITMFHATVNGSKLRQKETLLLAAKIDGYMNLCEGSMMILNVKLKPRHWPDHGVEFGAIRGWPELDLRIRTLVALQEGYRSLENFVKDYTRPKAAGINKKFIEGTATLYWHEIDGKEIREWPKK